MTKVGKGIRSEQEWAPAAGASEWAAPAGAASYAAEVDEQSIGEGFARELSDGVLEQTLECVIRGIVITETAAS